MSGGPAAGETPALFSDVFNAAYTTSMGALVLGECPKIGYAVDPVAWQALAGHYYDNVEKNAYDPKLFFKGGKYADQSAFIYLSLIKILEMNGPETFCANVATWAHNEHKRIGDSLIHRN